jgi:hypothetical protein
MIAHERAQRFPRARTPTCGTPQLMPRFVLYAVETTFNLDCTLNLVEAEHGRKPEWRSPRSV